MFSRWVQSAVLMMALLGQPVLAAEGDPRQTDPLEGFNRAIFSFNEGLDRMIVKPLTQGYQFVMPDVAEQGVSNFFSNLGDIGTFANNLLQGKVKEAGQDLSRVVINSTIGILGLFDVASDMNIPKHDEDFGQTLGVWGFESGPYLVLPVFGPSSIRDGIGRIGDYQVDPLPTVEDDESRMALGVLRVIDKRAELLKAEEIIAGDRYAFIRDAYLQRREFQVSDGAVEFNADDF